MVEISVGCRRKPTGIHKKAYRPIVKIWKKADRLLHKVVQYLLMNSTVTVFTIVKLQLVSLRVSKSLHLLTISPTLSLKNYIVLSLILVPMRMKQHVVNLSRVLPLTCSTRTLKKTAEGKVYCTPNWWDNRLGTATIEFNQNYSADKIFVTHLKMTY